VVGEFWLGGWGKEWLKDRSVVWKGSASQRKSSLTIVSRKSGIKEGIDNVPEEKGRRVKKGDRESSQSNTEGVHRVSILGKETTGGLEK